ncbi:phage protein NinX family protein [Pseudomonas sp. KCJK9111]|uniref:phage protein NinX family protein n=1 Tax=Pseudomonas sp. KCJK9111 TaxID=3344555 RepID=UPI003905F02F
MNDLIEVKTGDLVGESLGWAVGMAEGLALHLEPPQYGNGWRVFAIYRGEATERSKRYNPWEAWVLGGPLVAKYRIGFGLYSDSFFAVIGLDDIAGDGDGLTHLVAAMRAIIGAKLGDTVQVPKELMS